MKFDNIEVLSLAELPQSTETYRAVDHQELHDFAVNKIEALGLTITDTKFKSNRLGTQVIGLYSVDMGDDTFSGMIGWRNSYDKTRSVAIICGTSVYICGNGAVVGEMIFLHKHVGQVKNLIEPAFDTQLSKLDDMITQSRILFDKFSKRDINSWFRNATLGNLYMKDLITVTQLSKVKDQYEKSDYAYGYEGTLWELFNHCTHALKTTHPTRFFEAHHNLRTYFENI